MLSSKLELSATTMKLFHFKQFSIINYMVLGLYNVAYLRNLKCLMYLMDHISAMLPHHTSHNSCVTKITSNVNNIVKVI